MKLALGLSIGLLIYAVLAIAVGWHEVAEAIAMLPWWIWITGTLIVTVGYALMFLRWQLLLKTLGHPLDFRPSLSIYLAGLGLIAAPARSGEALRAVWLERKHQIPLKCGLAATVGERFLDLLSALLVLTWGLTMHSQHGVIVLLPVFVLVAAWWLLTHPRTLGTIEGQIRRLPLTRPWRGLRRTLWEGLQAISELDALKNPKTLALVLAISTGVWVMESGLIQLVLAQLNTRFSLQEAATIRTAMSLGGIISLLPAGLGTSEATSIGVSLLFGADKSQALCVTLVIRAVTLIYPTLVGLIAIRRQQRPDRPNNLVRKGLPIQ